ncbi:MAG: hypothetical protein A3H27_08470 [Acidobacteria bacterium RIFCSPLOWO2_02_FULL_59_13]|nr:MAG: hypothetical protein A3H27_08470 [Acidobacteria bacterium RIFCSPLOWO2_02_FULL_59_13]
MSISPASVPQPEELPPAQSSGISFRIFLVVVAALVIGLGGLLYYVVQLENRFEQTQNSLESNLRAQGEVLERLSQRLEQAEGRDAELRGEVTVAKNRLGLTQTELQKARQITLQLAEQQKQADEQIATRLGQLQQEQVATKGALGGLSTDVVGVKGEVKTTKVELEKTQSELKRVIGDLGVQSDLVAHNRAELEQLRLRGERDYLEFDLRKSSKRQRIGPVQLELRKTDVKRQKYTLNLVADDRTIEKKDKTVFEPVQFYLEGYGQPTEVVVNKIDKDRIVGYISVPKAKETREPMKSS